LVDLTLGVFIVLTFESILLSLGDINLVVTSLELSVLRILAYVIFSSYRSLVGVNSVIFKCEILKRCVSSRGEVSDLASMLISAAASADCLSLEILTSDISRKS
jgi:hypothetical protein